MIYKAVKFGGKAPLYVHDILKPLNLRYVTELGNSPLMRHCPEILNAVNGNLLTLNVRYGALVVLTHPSLPLAPTDVILLPSLKRIFPEPLAHLT